MTRPAAMFVAAAMAVTAACVGVIAAFGLGFGTGPSALAALAALAGMAMTHLAFVRAPAPDHHRLDDLDRVVTDLQSRLETAELRIATVDAQSAERARAAVRPLVEELASLGGLVTSVAKDVAAHDVRLAQVAGAKALQSATAALAEPPPAPPIAAPAESPPPSPNRRGQPEAFDPDEPEPASGARSPAARLDLALREGRIDIHLQPIVALPSRRTLHYEALARIVEADGAVEAEHFVALAAAERLIAAVDRRAFAKASAVALRLAASGRDGAVFVNIAPETLVDAVAMREIRDAVERQPELARLMVLEFAQSAFARFGPAERAALSGLTERGLRLSMDRVDDIRLDGQDLARQGVRFVKLAAARLLDPEAARGAAIHPADLAGLLDRHGVTLIATHVEDERTAPELLDMQVAAAQGFLFGVARPVRPPSDGPAPSAPASFRPPPRSASAR